LEHEIVSFVVAREVLEALGLPKGDASLVLLAMLGHHQAMASPAERLDQLVKHGWFRGRADLEALSSIISQGLGQPVRITKWPRNTSELDQLVAATWGEYCRRIYADLGAQLRARLLAGVLIAADYRVASKGEDPSGRTRLSAELERFFESLEELKREIEVP